MAKPKKTSNPTKRRSGTKTTARPKVPKKTKPEITNDVNTSTKNIDQVPNIQPVEPQKEHQEITAARILGRLTLFATIIGAIITAIVTIVANFPQYSLNLGYIHASQTANVVALTQTSQAANAPSKPPETPISNPSHTPAPSDTSIPTMTPTYTDDYLSIKRFLEELALMTERAISENNWLLVNEFYCGLQSKAKLENFKSWIVTLGENATARRTTENSSLEIVANPEPKIAWKVEQMETWLYSGDKQSITLQNKDIYTYYLVNTPTNGYCISKYETDWVSHEIFQK